MLDGDRNHDQKEDVDDPYHISSVRHALHDNIHGEGDDGVVHQPGHDEDDMKEEYWEVEEGDEEEGARHGVGEDVLVVDEGHGDVVHLDGDVVVLEGGSHGQDGVVEVQVEEEELVDVQVGELVKEQHYAYVVGGGDENHDVLQVVGPLEVEMRTLVLDEVVAPSVHDLEVFCVEVFLSFHFHFRSWCLL